MTTKIVEEFNTWCEENDIRIGQEMKLESVMIADWWLAKLISQKQELRKTIDETIRKTDQYNLDALYFLRKEIEKL